MSDFQKKVARWSRVCRTILILSALESLGLGASYGASNFEIRHFGIDLKDFEVAEDTGASDLRQSI